jgi:hypothetical protein
VLGEEEARRGVSGEICHGGALFGMELLFAGRAKVFAARNIENVGWGGVGAGQRGVPFNSRRVLDKKKNSYETVTHALWCARRLRNAGVTTVIAVGDRFSSTHY